MDDALRILEAALFAARTPLRPAEAAAALPRGADLDAMLARLAADYEGRGLVVSRTGAGLSIRTAPAASDLASAHARSMRREGRGRADVPRLSRQMLETLVCIAAFEAAGAPLTKGEIERAREVGLSANIFDTILAAGFVRPGRRRETRGRPLTWGVTEHFLDAYGLGSFAELPGYADALAAGSLAFGALERAGGEEADDVPVDGASAP